MDYDLRIFRENIFNLVKDLIGTYTYPSGDVLPAIVVVDGNEETNPEIRVSGVEVVIDKNPARFNEYKQYSGSPVSPVFYVRLVCWGPGGVWGPALKIKAAFAGSRIFPVTVPEGVGPRSQCVVEIPQNFFYSADQPLRYPQPG